MWFRVYEHGVDADVPFIVMELLEGEDLHTRLRRERRISFDDAAGILAQMSKGLRAAHDAGIIHRDLKPHNIFLAQEDGDMVVKILDFGVAKMEDIAGESTKTGAVLGSPHYMSPEQARGLSNVDHRADVWSMAVIAFRMVTGKMAFRGRATGDVIVKICSEPLPIASEVYRKIPAEIDSFFETAMQRKPDKRFQSAVALSAAFREAVRRSKEGPVPAPLQRHPDFDDEEKTAKLHTGLAVRSKTSVAESSTLTTALATTKAASDSPASIRTKATPRHGSPPATPPVAEEEQTSVDDGWHLDEDDSSETIPSAPLAKRSNPGPDFTGPRRPVDEETTQRSPRPDIGSAPIMHSPNMHESFDDQTPSTGHSVAGVAAASSRTISSRSAQPTTSKQDRRNASRSSAASSA